MVLKSRAYCALVVELLLATLVSPFSLVSGDSISYLARMFLGPVGRPESDSTRTPKCFWAPGAAPKAILREGQNVFEAQGAP